jgi:cysteine-rich repeat protein
MVLLFGLALGACGSLTDVDKGDASVPDAVDAPKTIDAAVDAFSGCTKTEDCDDGNPCNGVENCGQGSVCAPGTALVEGTACELDGDATTSDLCVDGACMPSRCGDAVVDPLRLEPCDDGNRDPGDGCEDDCSFSCADEAACGDGNTCNGTETCDLTLHVCAAGKALENATPCGEGRECHEGMCKPVGCGNKIVNTGEACDDGNMDEGDGCDNDCSFSCTDDAGCADADLCNGKETCDLTSHRCALGTVVVCADDGSACTDDHCDTQTGECVHPLKDGDGDKQASTSLGSCGTDCDDARMDIYLGAAELCDGVDNNCNVDIDENKPTWYVDCDKDGFASAAAVATAVKACNEPSSTATGCSGGWTTLFPVDASSIDCRDTNATVKPTQTVFQTTAIAGASTSSDYDYNCDAVEEKQYTKTSVTSGLCSGGVRSCTGTAGWTGTLVPVCGGSATLSYCYYSVLNFTCERASGTKKQGCR